jgi:hypothetical protein
MDQIQHKLRAGSQKDRENRGLEETKHMSKPMLKSC